MDFMNLNQAAHGDREFGFIETRLRTARKTVVGHWQDPAVADRIGAWARAACAWREAHHLRVARFGDNMRHVAVTEGDKVEAQIRLGVSVNGYGVSDLAAAIRSVPDAGASTTLVAAYADEYDLAPELVAAGTAPRRAPRGGADRVGPARVPHGRRLRCVHRHVRGPRRPAPAARSRRPAAHGRRLRLRRRGRLEDRGHGPPAQGHGDRPARAGRRSWRTTRTTSTRWRPKVLGAHMLEVCPSIAAGRPRCEIHPLSIGVAVGSGPARLRRGAGPGVRRRR